MQVDSFLLKCTQMSLPIWNCTHCRFKFAWWSIIIRIYCTTAKASKAGFRLAWHLPQCCVIITSHFRVAAFSSHTALAFSPSGITLKRNQLSAICCFGQSSQVIDWLVWCCVPLVLPSVASGDCAIVQTSPSKQQCGEQQASLKAA